MATDIRGGGEGRGNLKVLNKNVVSVAEDPSFRSPTTWALCDKEGPHLAAQSVLPGRLDGIRRAEGLLVVSRDPLLESPLQAEARCDPARKRGLLQFASSCYIHSRERG